MTLEASFDDLDARFQPLRDAVSYVRVIACEDKPATEATALVDLFCDAADDLLGFFEDAAGAAAAGRKATQYPVDVESARHSLTRCQKSFNDFSHRMESDLLSAHRLTQLTTFGTEHGGECGAWSDVLKEALDRCKQPSFDVHQALFVCWQELTERIGINTVSVITTNIGQRIESVDRKKPLKAEVR